MRIAKYPYIDIKCVKYDKKPDLGPIVDHFHDGLQK
jgi:hypothetical protein